MARIVRIGEGSSPARKQIARSSPEPWSSAVGAAVERAAIVETTEPTQEELEQVCNLLHECGPATQLLSKQPKRTKREIAENKKRNAIKLLEISSHTQGYHTSMLTKMRNLIEKGKYDEVFELALKLDAYKRMDGRVVVDDTPSEAQKEVSKARAALAESIDNSLAKWRPYG